MAKYVLTKEQRKFAEEYHELVYEYLNAKHLSEDDFYDITVFGYLRAVKKYTERMDLQEYSFKTVAWRAMDTDLYNYYKSQNFEKKKAVNISLDTMVNKLVNKEYFNDMPAMAA